MAVVIASGLGKDIAGEPLLRNVSFKLERRDRLTIAGRNGAGKTTLLRMLAGEASVDEGELTLAKDTRVALHDQRPPRERDLTLRDYVLSGCRELVALERELERLENEMAAGATDAATFDRYGRAQARLEHAGGYRWRDRAEEMVRGLGFDPGYLDRELRGFSGGELTRASLARALAGDPDLLMLDEPTNHLDIEALEWLEETLTALDAAVILVAHDRWFLEAVGTAVLELRAGRSRFFPGSWHAWRTEAAARDLAQGRAIERQEREIARLERFVERFRAGTRARQAQARQKRLDRVDRTQAAPAERAALAFEFKPPERSGRVVFEIEAGRVEVGSPPRVLLDQLEFWLERGEHVSLVGPNGAGKTTLLDALAGVGELAAGQLRRGHNVVLGYLSQHADELGGDATVIEATQRATKLTPNKARALLGRFLFSGDEAEKSLRDLSGGERQRLALALLVAGCSHVLILDEPTNHLDLESREALEDALHAFAGSLLLVSHDRALLDAVGTRIVAIEDGTLRSYAGGWAEYVRVRRERERAPSAPVRTAATPASADGNGATATKRARKKPARPAKVAPTLEEIAEREIEAAEAALRALEDELADPAAWATKYESEKSRARHTAARRAVEHAYARLEQLVD
jgi:ATP-binding cassette, subfamily F, member 3